MPPIAGLLCALDGTARDLLVESQALPQGFLGRPDTHARFVERHCGIIRGRVREGTTGYPATHHFTTSLWRASKTTKIYKEKQIANHVDQNKITRFPGVLARVQTNIEDSCAGRGS